MKNMSMCYFRIIFLFERDCLVSVDSSIIYWLVTQDASQSLMLLLFRPGRQWSRWYFSSLNCMKRLPIYGPWAPGSRLVPQDMAGHDRREEIAMYCQSQIPEGKKGFSLNSPKSPGHGRSQTAWRVRNFQTTTKTDNSTRLHMYFIPHSHTYSSGYAVIMQSHAVLPELGQSTSVRHHGSHSVRQGSWDPGSKASTARPLLPVPALGCSVLAWGSANISSSSFMRHKNK